MDEQENPPAHVKEVMREGELYDAVTVTRCLRTVNP
jgi:hypothetical protein